MSKDQDQGQEMGLWLDSLMYESWGSRALKGVFGDNVRTFATNGDALTIVDGAFTIAEDSTRISLVRRLLDMPAGHQLRRISMATLRAWLPSGPWKIDCETCKGGTIKKFPCGSCEGTGYQECSHCGHDDECDECNGAKSSNECPDCEGDSWKAAPPDCAPVADGVIINRHILQRFLGDLESDEIDVWTGGKLEPVHIIGSAWTVVMMPLRYESSLGKIGASLAVAQ